jgi:YD repeat-containing protein
VKRALLALLLIAIAPLLLGQSRDNVALGFNPNKMYQFGEVDHVNLNNGDLIINVPLGMSYGVDEGLSFQIGATYNSKVWNIVEDNDPNADLPYGGIFARAFPNPRNNAGLGWRVSLGMLVPPWEPRNHADSEEIHGWQYIGPAGDEHDFDFYCTDFSHCSEHTAQSVARTIDSTYLTLTLTDSTHAYVNFPNGEVRRFELTHEHWRLTEMQSPLGRKLSISYDFDPTDGRKIRQWIITDLFAGRTHTVHFKAMAGSQATSTDDYGRIIDYIEFQTVADEPEDPPRTVRYTFNYTLGSVQRPCEQTHDWVINPYSTPNETFESREMKLPLLTSISLPDGSSWTFDNYGYDERCQSGLVSRMTLPTGGTYDYKYGTWIFPPIVMCDGDADAALKKTAGIFERKIDGLYTWEYHHDYAYPTSIVADHLELCPLCRDGANGLAPDPLLGCSHTGPTTQPSRWTRTSVLNPHHDRTDYYFGGWSTYPADPTGIGSSMYEYGLPYTRGIYEPGSTTQEKETKDSDGRYLSTQTFENCGSITVGPLPPISEDYVGNNGPCTGSDVKLLRTTYVRYEHDGVASADTFNSRVASDRTEFNDDPEGCLSGSAACGHADTNRSEFDTLGHYRKEITAGNFAGANEVTTFTNYNPGDAIPGWTAGTNPPTNGWHLGTYTEQKKSFGTAVVRALYCFDNNGFLRRRRAIKDTTAGTVGNEDVVSVYTRTTNELTATIKEETFGGDGASLGTDDATFCSATYSTPKYRTDYTFKNGVMMKAEVFDGNALKFLSIDRTLDDSTGLVRYSRDAAGVQTRYDYDLSGRLTKVTPPSGIATTSYAYFPATANAFAYVEETSSSPDGTKKQYQFDRQGRLWREKGVMPEGAWTVRETLYDGMGWKASVSEPATLPGTNDDTFVPPYKTIYSYDAFGRPLSITTPDGFSTTMTYDGIGTMHRTATIAMEQGLTPKTTEETYDRFGRLVDVKEPNDVHTAYGYDAAGNLAHVCMNAPGVADWSNCTNGQPRTFTYDGRGFLLSEQHPENGLFRYKYDPKGHVTSRYRDDTSDFDLVFGYDFAERLRTVTAGASVLKEFDYGENAASSSDRNMGKLITATRHNRLHRETDQPGVTHDYTVTERYYYEDVAGRQNRKVTEIHDPIADTTKRVIQSQTYNDLSLPATVTYPHCETGCDGPELTITNTFTKAMLTRVGTAGSDIARFGYSPGGINTRIEHVNQAGTITDTYTLDNMSRPSAIEFQSFQCAAPNVTALTGSAWTPGAAVTITVQTTGQGPIAYQWYDAVTNQPIAGATGATYTTPALNTGGRYFVRLTNECGQRDSSAIGFGDAQCNFNITTQPAGATINAGETRPLSVVAESTSGAGMTYQWYRGTSGDTSLRIDGATSSTYTPPPVTATVSFWVRVTADGCTADSDTATLAICEPIVIRVQPRNSIKAPPGAGNTITLTTSIDVTGTNLTLQWYEVRPDGTFDDTHPQYTPTLSVPFSGSATDIRTYRVRIADSCHSQPVWSDPVKIGIGTCVNVLTNPQDTIAFQGANAFYMAVLVEGEVAPNSGTPLKFEYHWHHGIGGDDAELIGAQFSKPEILASMTSAQYDAFWCVIKDPVCGQETVTPKAYVHMYGYCALPPLSVLPQKVTIGASSAQSFTATVDWPYVTYQWYRGVTGDTRYVITGATHAAYAPDSQGAYWLRVTDECGNNHEDSPTLTASTSSCNPAVITVQPQSVDIAWGDRPTLHFEADNTTMFRWYEEGNTTIRSWSKNFTVNPSPLLTTTYYASASNGCHSMNSLPATVHIKRCASINVIAQPASGTILSTEAAGINLAVNATSTGGAIHYQWYAGETGDTTDLIAGEINSSIHVLPSLTTSYWVRLTTDSCTIDSDTAVVTVCTPPQFTTPSTPVTNDIQYGQSLRIGGTATGTGLQWTWHAGSPTSEIIVGTSPIITVKPSFTTVYYGVVTGACGSITTAPITVRVCMTPGIDQQPANVTVFSGKTATLSVDAFEALDVPVSYVWQEVNGPSVATTPTFTTPAITAPKQYVAHVTAGICSIDSNVATVSVCTLPEIIITGTTQNAAVGQSVTLSCVFSPVSSNNVFTWYMGPVGDFANSTQISYNSSTTYTYTAAQAGTFTFWASVQRTDDGCVSHTNAYTVNVCIPTITQQPQPGGYDLVHPVTLSVTATSAGSYQWYTGNKGDTANQVAGATTASITVTPAADTNYWCRVTGSCGTADSNSVLVTRCQPPAITSQPVGGGITRGQSLSIGLSATGTNLSYQWYQGASGNTANPVYGNTPGITVNPLNTTDYWVKVSGLCGTAVNSNTAHVTVCTTPVINTQPVGTNVFSGQTATLTVSASEATSEPLHYQWFTAANAPVGSDSPTFTTPPITQQMQYYVRVSAVGCSIDSSMATVGLCTLPSVITTGTTQNVAIGQTVTLSAVFSPGTGNTFVWYSGPVGDVAHSAQVSSNNSNTFSFVAAATSGGTYWATVSRSDDGCASRTNAYTVNVCVPSITAQPAASTMINSGQSLTLSVAANTSGLTYQWYIGTSGTTTTPISGATGASVTVTPASNTNYWVKVTGSCSQSANSNTAVVTICQPPAITAQPSPNAYIVRGTSVSLGVTATGNGLTYQWYQGTSGNTSSPLAATTPGMTVTPQNPIDYWVKVTGTCGSQNSNTAHVAVCVTPVINTQPANTSVFSGGSATLTVSASEATGEALHYQWYKNGTTPVGTDSATLNTGALTTDTTFYVHITAASGTCAADSATATVSMCPLAQTVTGAPNQNTTPGQTVRLQLPTMPGATAYLWYSGASGNTSAPVTGWQAANYMDVSPGTTMSWWAQVQNGSCVSNTTTTTVNVCIPTITQQPASTTVASGPVTLTVASNLTGSTYQWYVGSSGTTTNPIAGATSASVSVSPASTTTYWCKVSGSCGTANSNAATVTICTVPTITGQPLAPTVYRGTATGITVTATGTSLTYQWYTGASGDTSHPVSGATSATYSLTAYNSERYWARVTGMCGTRDSNAVWISIIPQILQQPVQTTYLSSGSRVQLNVNVYSNTYLHYAWCYDATGQPVPGAPDAPVWTTPDITASNVYFCRVTSGNASTDSYRAYVNLCDGGNGANQPYATSAGGTCRYLWSNAGGNWDHIEWYQGQKGDVSYQIGNGNYVYSCSSVGTSVWYRVVGYDSNQGQSCYTDSPALTVP